MSKLIIGLTGGIGSGKTTLTDQFAKLGVDIIDADIIAREVVAVNSPALASIVNYFGDDFILDDGQLNRTLLRQRIFANDSDKLWLNNLLHPIIRAEIQRQTSLAKSPYCILVAPLLIENKLNELVDRVLVVDVSEETQITRTLSRDTSNREEVKSIMASQISRTDRLNAADDIFNNENLNLEDVHQHALAFDIKYLNLTIMV